MTRPLVRILIADPYPILRRGLKVLLGTHDCYEVVAEAADAGEALRLADELSPAISIIACSFADLGGVALAEKIRRVCPRSEILMYASSYRESVLVAAQQAGIKGFVLKSDPGRNVVAALDSLCLGRPYYSEGIPEALLERLAQTRVRPSSDCLTPRERDVVEHIASGCSNKQIGKLIEMSFKTVETHRAHVMEKLGLRTTAELVRFAVRNDLIAA